MRCSKVYATACAVTVLVSGLALLATVSTEAAPQSATLRARAVITGEGITGSADFREVAAGSAGATDPRFPVGTVAVEVVLKVKGLKPGAHGVHIHEVGKVRADVRGRGRHFDPGPHGMSDPDANHPYHMGDLPNLIANELARGTFTARTTRITLSPGPLSCSTRTARRLSCTPIPTRALPESRSRAWRRRQDRLRRDRARAVEADL